MMEYRSTLPLILTFLPMTGAVIMFSVGRYDEKWRNQIGIAITVITVLLSIALFRLVLTGSVIFSLPWFLGFGLTFRVDFISGLFALIVSIIWLLCMIYAEGYMAHEHNRTRFFTFFIFTLGACLGVFLAGDHLSELSQPTSVLGLFLVLRWSVLA